VLEKLNLDGRAQGVGKKEAGRLEGWAREGRRKGGREVQGGGVREVRGRMRGERRDEGCRKMGACSSLCDASPL